MFQARGGGPLRFGISETFDRAVNALGLNDGITDARHRVRFHTLRHTFASWLAQSGEVTLQELREYMKTCPVCGKPFVQTSEPQPSGVDASLANAFRNPANGHIERIDGAWAWVLLFGCIYFAAKGVWTHVLTMLGDRKSDTKILNEAATCLQDAIDVFTRAGPSPLLEMAKNNLARIEELLQKFGG